MGCRHSTDPPGGSAAAAPPKGNPSCCLWRSALTRRRSSRLARRCSMLLTTGLLTPSEAGDCGCAGRLPGSDDCLQHNVMTLPRRQLYCEAISVSHDHEEAR